jgi:hypothetical protein
MSTQYEKEIDILFKSFTLTDRQSKNVFARVAAVERPSIRLLFRIMTTFELELQLESKTPT